MQDMANVRPWTNHVRIPIDLRNPAPYAEGITVAIPELILADDEEY
jgi:hypothetical protein